MHSLVPWYIHRQCQQEEKLGKAEVQQMVSAACKQGGQSKLVMESKQAFALLLFEFIDKLKTFAYSGNAAKSDKRVHGEGEWTL